MSIEDESAPDPPVAGVNTGGGAFIDGNVQVTNGDFVGIKIVYTRSQKEELDDYLRTAAPLFEKRTRESAVRTEKLTNPYKFLDVYAVKDSDIYFGRDAAADDLYGRVLGSRLTVVHAPSGSGKSSLLRAGIGKRLIEQNRLPVYIPSIDPRAYEHPIDAIKAALVPPSLQLARPQLFSALSLPEFMGIFIEKLSRRTQELVLVLDQFEEFFILAAPSSQLRAFVDALAVCCADENLPLRIVIAIRKDYLSELAGLKQSLPKIFLNEFRLEPMNREEIIAAITGPLTAAAAGVSVEQALQDRLADDLTQGEFELFLLQLYCDSLYKQVGQDKIIQLESYEKLKQSERGPLSDYIQNMVLERLPYRARQSAKRVLVKLISEKNTRQAVLDTDLTQQLGLAPEEYRTVLSTLVGAHLVERSETDEGYVYTLTHDSVALEVRKWFAWIQPTADQIRLVQVAMRSGFSVGDLLAMIRVELGEDLRSIVPYFGRTYRQIVDDLILYFATQLNGLQKLAAAAQRQNPDNPDVVAAAVSLRDIQLLPLPRLEDALVDVFDPEEFQQWMYLALELDLGAIFPIDTLSLRQLVSLVVSHYDNVPGGVSKLLAAARAVRPHVYKLEEVEKVLSNIGRITVAEHKIDQYPLWKISVLMAEELDSFAKLDAFASIYLQVELDQIATDRSFTTAVCSLLIHYCRQQQGLQTLVAAVRNIASERGAAELDQALAMYQQQQLHATGLESLQNPSGIAPEIVAAVEKAILDSYSSKTALEQMVRINLDENLSDITPVEGSRRQVVHALMVNYLSREAGLQKLVHAMRTDIPGSDRVAELERQLQGMP
jgi:hypothetical protein